MASSALACIRQVCNGKDFDSPTKLLSNIKPDQAVLVLPFAPYSIATNVAHADIWQRIWLARIQRLPRINPFPDFPVVEAHRWEEVRSSFLTNIELALELAEKDDGRHDSVFFQIALHNSYHLGQVKLLKRMARGQRA